MGNTSQKNRHISGEDSGPSLTTGKFITHSDPNFDSNDIYHTPHYKRSRASTTTSPGQVDFAKPSQILPSVFKWEGGGKEVYMSGSFNDWKYRIPMTKSHGDFYTILELSEGDHQYKFMVDGNWVHDPNEPTVQNSLGTLNNVIKVKNTDFEVFEALALDSQVTDDRRKQELNYTATGDYGQVIPTRRPGEKHSGPPILPPHLLQVILNKDTPAHYEPTLLPEPNHVMLNHLYALSIKDGVMVLSATHRFRKKYVTTLLYKPT